MFILHVLLFGQLRQLRMHTQDIHKHSILLLWLCPLQTVLFYVTSWYGHTFKMIWSIPAPFTSVGFTFSQVSLFFLTWHYDNTKKKEKQKTNVDLATLQKGHDVTRSSKGGEVIIVIPKGLKIFIGLVHRFGHILNMTIFQIRNSMRSSDVTHALIHMISNRRRDSGFRHETC